LPPGASDGTGFVADDMVPEALRHRP
jgi:hypothetical protein